MLRDRRAVSALEFAIIGSVLFVSSLGVIDLGMILWTQGSLQAVAAEAARCGAISASGCTTSSAVQTYVQNHEHDGLGLDHKREQLGQHRHMSGNLDRDL
jgi:Flp pilus assembly protein TadG